MREVNWPMLDGCAAWVAEQYESDLAQQMPGSPDWNVLRAHINVVRLYEETRARQAAGSTAPLIEGGARALGLAIRHLSMALNTRPGWVHAWRPE